jgi:hypothetical protein
MPIRHESVPIADHSQSERRDLAEQISEFAHDPQDVRLLKIRHLFGFLLRHGGKHNNPETSLTRLNAAAEADPATLSMRVLYEVNKAGSRVWAGLATTQPGLALREHRPIPITKYTYPIDMEKRGRIPHIVWAKNMTRHHLIVPGGPNVSAIVPHAATNPYEALRTGYHDMTSGEKRSWTIEPIASPPYVTDAIIDAGLAVVDSGTYDDEEWRTWRRIHLSRLLIQGHTAEDVISREIVSGHQIDVDPA